MNTTESQIRELHSQIERAHENIAGLESELVSVGVALEKEEGAQERFDTLDQICVLLNRLDEIGGADLFLGEQANSVDMSSYVQQLQGRVDNYTGKVAALREKREQITADIRSQKNRISLAQESIIEIREAEERKKYEYVVEREMTRLPYRRMVMPWSSGTEDDKQARRYIAVAFLYSILLWLVVDMIVVPLPDVAEEVKIPERLAKLIKKEEPKPKTQENTEQVQNQAPSKTREEARKKVQNTGLLAFKDNFTELMNMASVEDLGASADISNSGAQSTQAARNLVVAKASGVSGISSAKLSRNTGGAGKGLKGGIQFTRVESSIGIGDGGPDRPTGSGAPPRTDEEIQIIFDKYKSALYRIYQRELRKDPTLRGNMVLRITIEADGTVSLCRVDSTDLRSQTLLTKIVARVKRFNFGERKGAPKMTILYPIDFLPAT